VEGDAVCLRLDKGADLQVTYAAIEGIRDRLGYAFLMSSSIQRNGERVTAEEIRMLSQELQDLLSGSFQVISREFQVPFIRRVMQRMTDQRRLPALPEEVISIQVVGGVEGMGRGHDRDRLVGWAQAVSQLAGPQALEQYGDARTFMERLAHADGLQPEGLVKTEEEVQEMQQQAMQQQLLQQAAPGVIQDGAKALIERGMNTQ
jgi:hypothetical protein